MTFSCFPMPLKVDAKSVKLTHAGINPCLLVSYAGDSEGSFSGDKCFGAHFPFSSPATFPIVARDQLLAFGPLNCRPM